MAAATPESRASERFTGQARASLSGMGKVFAGFKEFISRGNALELAVGVAIGAAFGVVVDDINKGILGPLVAMVLRGNDLANSLTWNWLGSTFSLGLVLDGVITFLLTALAIYFAVVLPLNAFARRRARGEEPAEEAPPEDVALLREIRDLLAAGAPADAVGAPLTATGAGTVPTTGSGAGSATGTGAVPATGPSAGATTAGGPNEGTAPATGPTTSAAPTTGPGTDGGASDEGDGEPGAGDGSTDEDDGRSSGGTALPPSFPPGS